MTESFQCSSLTEISDLQEIFTIFGSKKEGKHPVQMPMGQTFFFFSLLG